MKLKYEFSVREIAGDYILVPLGEAALKLSGMITTNEVGAFMWEALKEEITEEKMIQKITEEFEADQETIEADVKEFLDNLRKLDLLEE